jgi:hypothetical protein
MTHVAWNCDGKKLAAVGIDKSTRIWSPEKSVSFDFEMAMRIYIYIKPVWVDGVKSCNPFLRRAF